MVGDDEYAFVLAEIVEWNAVHSQIVFAALADKGEIGIVVADFGSLLPQQLNNGEGRRFTEVVDVFFVGDAQYQDFGTFQRFLALIERVDHGAQYVVRHGSIDFAGKLDESGVKIKLLG